MNKNEILNKLKICKKEEHLIGWEYDFNNKENELLGKWWNIILYCADCDFIFKRAEIKVFNALATAMSKILSNYDENSDDYDYFHITKITNE